MLYYRLGKLSNDKRSSLLVPFFKKKIVNTTPSLIDHPAVLNWLALELHDDGASDLTHRRAQVSIDNIEIKVYT